MHVLFPYYHLELNLPSGTTVHEACRLAGYPINTACSGMGQCGKCLVIIRQNGITAQILACQQVITPNMEILISPDQREEKLLTETVSPESFLLDPLVHFYPVAKDSLVEETKKEEKTLLEILNDWLPVSLSCLSFKTNHELNRCLNNSAPLLNLMTVSANNNKQENILQFQSTFETPSLYGIAFDIGTTSVAGYLLDLDDGWLCASDAKLNAQTTYGADIISRIQTVKQNPEHLYPLYQMIWETLKVLADILCKKAGIKIEQVSAMTYCGNSVMIELLCGNDPRFLGETPFLLANKGGMHWTGNVLPFLKIEEKSFYLPVSEACYHYILPGIGGFIGSDTTAVLLTLPNDDQFRLVIDLGTNCEIAFGKNETYTITSAACGPAFEGAGITMGMRSSTGAIEHCRFSENQLCFDIIEGDTFPASGICGSGLIDCVATLLELGIIQPDGCFSEEPPKEFSSLKKRFGKTKTNERYFTLLFSNENQNASEIILTQKDIRQLQLAIAAIRTGWQKLLSINKIKPDTISSVFLSGAFGAGINLENAKKIGLIPDFENVPVFTLGNGAGAGVQQVLLSRDAQKKANRISENCHVINLADCSDFNQYFCENLSFHSVSR